MVITAEGSDAFMLRSSSRLKCAECSGEVVDVGDEMACRACGIVIEKEVIESGPFRVPRAVDFTKQALGGYLGPIEYRRGERSPAGIGDGASTFRYLKLISDYAGKDDTTTYSTLRLVERVCEKLSLPGFVAAQAVVVAKRLLPIRKEKGEVTSAAVSAHAIVTACKIAGVASVGLREIVEAHRALGRRVKTSAMIQLSLDSPFRAGARRAEDYVGRVTARLGSDPALRETLRECGLAEVPYFNRLHAAAMRALSMLDSCARGGHNPCALAATAVYAGEAALSKRDGRSRLLTQREVAECVAVAEYTVREQFGVIFRGRMADLEALLMG